MKIMKLRNTIYVFFNSTMVLFIGIMVIVAVFVGLNWDHLPKLMGHIKNIKNETVQSNDYSQYVRLIFVVIKMEQS